PAPVKAMKTNHLTGSQRAGGELIRQSDRDPDRGFVLISKSSENALRHWLRGPVGTDVAVNNQLAEIVPDTQRISTSTRKPPFRGRLLDSRIFIELSMRMRCTPV